MREIDDFLGRARSQSKTFHPVHERNGDAWFPGNEAASLLVQIGHIWEDIAEIHKLYLSQKGSYVEKLLLKYIVIEVRSLVQVFDRLQAIVLKAPVFDPKERQGWREITAAEQDKAKALLKIYTKAKAETNQKIISIRNEIGAHRGNLNWNDVMKFWDALTPDVVRPILDSVPAAYAYIKELDLYEWNRVHPNGVHEFISAQLRPEYFEYFSSGDAGK
jgi:hypothetical protein